MDSFTMQKDLHPLFAPFCNLQSAHTISRRLWREVRISTSVARSQATARTNSRSQTPLEHLHRRRFASTSSSIYCCSWQEICHLRDLTLKGIYDLQSKDLPMLRRDFHVCLPRKWPLGRVLSCHTAVAVRRAVETVECFLETVSLNILCAMRHTY